MAPLRHQSFVLVVCLVALGVLSSATAQPGQGRRQATPAYDMTTEARFTGTVESVEDVARPDRLGRRHLGGTHLMLQTASGTLDVHLGPTAFLKANTVTVAKGNTVDILGSRITIDDELVVLAREITLGNKTWVLRDSEGRPRWSRSWR